MQTPTPFRLAPLCAASLLLLAAGSADAAVGLRVLAVDWNPAQPSQQATRRLVDEPSGVSDAIRDGWQAARPVICRELQKKLGLGGVAGGFTLRDIDCVLDETPVYAIAKNGANGLRATLSVAGYLAATSTTPDYIPRGLDPRFSIRVKATIALAIAVQPNPAQTLRVDAAGFQLGDTSIDSHNLSGDVLKFVAEDLARFFAGTDFRQYAENAVNAVGGDVARPFNAAFRPVNDRLRPPAGLVRVAVWARPDLLAFAYAPAEVAPPAGGSLSGVFRWQAGTTPGRCDGLSLAASVQTGPAPIEPDGRFVVADAPRKPVGDFRLEGTGAAGECRYRITGLAAGWQNDLVAAGRTETDRVAATRGNTPARFRTTLKGDGWDGLHVRPQPSAQGNYAIVTSTQASPVLHDEVTANRQVPNVGGVRRPNPGDRFGSDAAVTATTLPGSIGQVTPAATQPRAWTTTTTTGPGPIGAPAGTANRLNPQPLPPGSMPARAGTQLKGP